ncbi:MAG: Nre family DNA repair protein [Methanosarcinales archaeon]|nr:Nre family DNA repair protein [ANME-2 cluster archaeon]MDF1530718.1 Nre family DNA repair protein [ANME-2 cluster archaeon]MDW7774742.1 Nre family DNA repair protein [Methanosarcinales archaeon]
MTSLCVSCKGKGRCGRPACPVLEKFKPLGTTEKLSDNIFGSSPPSVFVGRYGYPQVSAGPLVPPDVLGAAAENYDAPASWNNLDIGEIIALRSSLVRSNMHFNVKDAGKPDAMLQKTQELALSGTPVDTEVWFRKPPRMDLRFDGVLSPMGPAGEVTRLDIAQNPVVPRHVDRAVGDSDVAAVDAIREMYRADVSTDHINRLLSIGLLGKKRTIVPTRWSITATDDMIGKMLAEDIRYYPETGEIQVFSGGLHGNHFEILVIPGPPAFELIEIWMPRAVWTGGTTVIEADQEDHSGKKRYSNLGGGYYAARLPVQEHLHDLRRSASVFAIREITPDYWAPLGVWVVREAARYAMSMPPLKFDSVDAALTDMSTRLNTGKDEWYHRSNLLDKRRNQRTLLDFL